jgi:hypothetical protein
MAPLVRQFGSHIKCRQRLFSRLRVLLALDPAPVQAHAGERFAHNGSVGTVREGFAVVTAGSAGGEEEFTNRCLDSILNRSSNELRNDFVAARPTSKQQNRCLESWYSSIVS